MKTLIPLLLSLLPASAPAQEAGAEDSTQRLLARLGRLDDLVALRARRVETVAGGTIEHAVILVENGKIAAIGQDLPIERGIPIVELPEGWTVLPGLVNAYTRAGMDGNGANDSQGHVRASDELYPASKDYVRLLEAGITTLGLYPAGNGIPGKAVAVRPAGQSREEMILADDVYLKIVMRSSGSAKKLIRDGFKGADDYLEKEAKNREKWEKEQEKKKKPAKKDEEKKDEEKKEEEKKEDGAGAAQEGGGGEKAKEAASDEYVPLEPDPKVKPFLDLRSGDLKALITLSQSSDYLHLLDAIGEEEFEWDLRIGLARDTDVFHVLERIAKRGCRVIMEPSITLHPGTMRQRNLPAEYARAGIDLVLVPDGDGLNDQREWLRDVGRIVATGLPRQAALRAMTLAPAELLGLAERVGSLEVGKDANLVLVDGDPFEPATKVMGVMLEGRLYSGEVEL